MKFQDIYWGEDTAEHDDDLLEYFIIPDEYEKIKNLRKMFCTGRKGAGKSAIRKKVFDTLTKEKNTFVVEIIPEYSVIQSLLKDNEISEKFNDEIFFEYVWLSFILKTVLIKIGSQYKGTLTLDSFEYARELAKQNYITNLDIIETITDMVQKIKVKAGSIGDLGIEIAKDLEKYSNVKVFEHHIKEILKIQEIKVVVLVDNLDVGWDNTELSNKFLLGLLHAKVRLKSFGRRLGIVTFIRDDMYSILMSKTQHSDRFRDVAYIEWDKEKFKNLIEERLKFNFRKANINIPYDIFHAVFPEKVGVPLTMNWLFERTLGRPRELILLCRLYTEALKDNNPCGEVLKNIEKAYSDLKLGDLCSEYLYIYPGLELIFDFWKPLFKKEKYNIKIDDFEKKIKYLFSNFNKQIEWFEEIKKNADTKKFMEILYDLGFIGDYIIGGHQGGSQTHYSNEIGHVPRFDIIQIHPCFRKSMGTSEK